MVYALKINVKKYDAMLCEEVRVLRTFTKDKTRVIDSLCRRYTDGRRCANDIIMALDALWSQNHESHCRHLLTEALTGVTPVPLLLWTWACAHVNILGVEAIRYMLALSSADKCYEKRLNKDVLADTPDGLVALMYEMQRFPAWAPEAVQRGIARFYPSKQV